MSDTPMVFRKEQINTFIESMTQAITFSGPNYQSYSDEFIEGVIEEVANHEADLSSARVAIEKYVIASLAKNPEDVIMMRIHDNIQPIIEEVIQIEIKMYGNPKYVVTKANNSGQAWSLEALKSNPLIDITLPQEVAQEASKYNFTTVTAPVLPDPEPTINEYRCSFFNELSEKENEKDWLKKFQEEASFALIDLCLLSSNHQEQISLFTTKQLKEYVSSDARTEKQLDYERECEVPEYEIEPGKFILSARNPSLRAFFTLLQLTSELKNDFIKFIEKNRDEIRNTFDLSEEEFCNGSVEEFFINVSTDALILIYGKHPIQEFDFKVLKTLFKFFEKELKGHFYKALSELASYYEERKFFDSSMNCHLLIECLANDHGCAPEKPQEALESNKNINISEDISSNENEEEPNKNIDVGIYFE